MTDNNQILANNHAVTSDCLYNLKSSSVSGRSYRASIPPTNGSTFTPTSTMVMYIPARRNCYLDGNSSYLKLTIKNNDGAAVAMTLDSWGACVINAIQIYSGSNLIESINGYNILANALLDTQMNQSNRTSISAMYGTGSVMNDNLIERKGETINAGKSLTVCIPIISSLFSLAEKYMPLNLADDIRLEITFEQDTLAVVGAARSAPWSIINAELELIICELGDEGVGLINSISPPNAPIYIHSSTYKHYTSSIPITGAGSTYSTLVPARFASLKSLWLCPRRATEIADVASYALSSRVNFQISQYWWRVGSLMIPNKPVSLAGGFTFGYSEAYAEMLRATHSLNNTTYGNCISMTEYQVADVTDANVGDGNGTSCVLAVQTGANSYKNGFIIGQELETFSLRNDVILSGLNSLGSQIFFECNINATAGPTAAYTLDFYAYADVIFVIQDGLINVRL